MVETKTISFTEIFKITDHASCERAIKSGGVTAAMISALLTAIFGCIGLFTSSSDNVLAYVLDPLILVDATLFVVLAAFVFRKSRTASTLLVIYFVLGKTMMWYETGMVPGGMSILFFLFYVTAMRGTFIWHSTYKNALIGVAA